VDRGEGPVVALGHGVEHGDDLVAEHLAHDHPGRVHAQRPAYQLGHGDLPLPLGVGQPLLEGHDVGVQLGELVQPQLKGPLHGDQPLVRRDLVRQGAQQRRLPGVRRPRDHDVLPRHYGGGEETPDLRGDGAVAHQVGQEDLAEAGAPDRHGRPQRHVHHGREPRPVGQPQVELRVGGVERAAGQAGVGREDLDQLDELLVGLGDRLVHELLAVGVADEDPVAAVDVDVLDLGIVQERLQAPDAEQGGVDPGG
jgi:hypothetical protein